MASRVSIELAARSVPYIERGRHARAGRCRRPIRLQNVLHGRRAYRRAITIERPYGSGDVGNVLQRERFPRSSRDNLDRVENVRRSGQCSIRDSGRFQ